MYVYDTVQRNSADCYGIQIKRKCTNVVVGLWKVNLTIGINELVKGAHD